eukprot:m.104512 g.104512  ORF g.104512 m.104512 type:complete len:891 (-) comp12638_c0_seq5:132-2804(-)
MGDKDMKAFDVRPLLTNIRRDPTLEISTVEMWKESVWIGTTTGRLISYQLTSEVDERKKQVHRWSYLREVTFGSSAVKNIKIAHQANKLFVLCDKRLFILYKDTLEKMMEPLKNISLFCVDEAWRQASSETSSFHITCISTKNVLSSYELLGKTLSPNKRYQEQRNDLHNIQTMAREGRRVVMAKAYIYYTFDLLTGKKTEIAPVGSRSVVPIVQWIMEGEFLVVTEVDGYSLGLCISAQGEAIRAPIQWVEYPDSVAYSNPYIVAYCATSRSILVTNINTQVPIQWLDCKEGHLFNDSGGGVLLSGRGALSFLKATSFESQIHDLILARRVNEALDLAENTLEQELLTCEEGSVRGEELKRKIRKIKRQAGFHKISEKDFKKGFSLLIASSTSPDIVLELFPLVRGEGEERHDNPYCPFKSIKEIVETKEEEKSAYLSLMEFLEQMHEDLHSRLRMLVDTALAILYAVYNGEKLNAFVRNRDTKCNLSMCGPVLSDANKLHALACLYVQVEQYQRALEIWKSLEEDPTIIDDDYPGIEFVIKTICDITTNTPRLRDLIFKNMDWILNITPEGVKMFISKSNTENQSLFPPIDVLSRLENHPTAKINYLEYLVFTLHSESEAYHTTLAMMLLDAVKRKRLENANRERQNLEVDTSALESIRHRFLRVLKSSKFYDVEKLLRLLDTTDLHAESAIVYGRAGKHEEALQRIVYKLEDYKLAEEYCSETTEGDRSLRRKLFLLLLKVYIQPGEGHEPLPEKAVKMLNSYLSDLDVIEVLKILPGHWKMTIIDNFLRMAIRSDVHYTRTTALVKGLARSENIQLNRKLVSLQQQRVLVSEQQNSNCMLCDRSLIVNSTVSPFVRYPNGVIVCLHCGQDTTTCPVTKKKFRHIAE